MTYRTNPPVANAIAIHGSKKKKKKMCFVVLVWRL